MERLRSDYFAQYYALIWFATALVMAGSGIALIQKVDLGKFVWRLESRNMIWVLLLSVSGGLFWFCCHFGNIQFGGFDQSALIDTGWRLFQGQKPYTDFICTLPPGFYLGAEYAFRLFGPVWDAQLYVAGAFASASFLWIYFLFAQLLPSRLGALGAALAVECVSMVLISFWWYNSIASVAGAIFALSCLVYFAHPKRPASQLSLVASLILLGLMKPNTSAPLIAGSLPLLIIFCRERARTLALVLVSFVGLWAFLALNGVSLEQVFRSYVEASESRGQITKAYGIRGSRLLTQFNFLAFTAALGVPAALVWVKGVVSLARNRRSADLGFYLLLAVTAVTSLIAMITNGEQKFVDMVLLIVFGTVVLFGNSVLITSNGLSGTRICSLYSGLLLGLVLIGTYTGVTRFRIYTVGDRQFFQLPDNRRAVVPFFPNLRTGARLVNVLTEERDCLDKHPANPIFFGPRMEFGYAAFRLPSPMSLPIWWDPGTSFSKSKESEMLSRWKGKRFGTLIFLKDDFTYYGPDFLAVLSQMYTVDQQYLDLTVLRIK